jgi:hypothetical protein
MKSAFSVLAIACTLGLAACLLTGCGSSTTTSDKMSGSKSGMEDKMTTDKTGPDKMTTDKMDSDKKSSDKMDSDKVGH